MELAELISAVKAAATKDALESLVKTELSLDLDKRKSLKALRAEVLKGLGETAEEGDDEDGGDTNGNGATDEGSAPAGSTGDTAGASAETPAAAPVAPVAAAPAPAAAPEPSPGPAPAPVSPPELEEGPEPEIQPAVGNRLLRHKTTGRTFVWTPALAASADLEEV